MNQLSFSQYCHNMTERHASISLVRKDGVSTLYHKGKVITQQEIDELYPVHLQVVNKHSKKTGLGANPDKRKNWITDTKAY